MWTWVTDQHKTDLKSKKSVSSRDLKHNVIQSCTYYHYYEIVRCEVGKYANFKRQGSEVNKQGSDVSFPNDIKFFYEIHSAFSSLHIICKHSRGIKTEKKNTNVELFRGIS